MQCSRYLQTATVYTIVHALMRREQKNEEIILHETKIKKERIGGREDI